MRVIVVKAIDRREPGEDVTGVYAPEVERRLIDEGYLAVDAPPAKPKGKKAVSDDGSTD